MSGLNIKPNIDYLKTPQAILKIVQIVTLLIAFSCITNCCDGGKPYYEAQTIVQNYWYIILRGLVSSNQQQTVKASEIIYYNRNTNFFQAVTILGWLLVVFLFTFFFLRLHARFNQINWELVVMIISIVWSVLLLLCCSLMGNIASTVFPMRPTGSSASSRGAAGGEDFLKRYIDTMVTGVAFGFFAWIAFIVDAALLFWQFWSKRKDGNNGSPDDPTVTKVSEAPGPSGSTTQNTQPQVPPAQTRQAPPKYETVTNLPGQTVTNTAGQTVQYSTPQTVPYTMGQTAPAGQAMVMYPSGQQQQYYQSPSGQPVQWKMA